MKPFDLAAALSGAPVVTRDNRPVIEIKMRKNPEMTDWPVSGIVDGGRRRGFDEDGNFFDPAVPNPLDLFMK